MNDFVSKPFDPQALIRKLRRLVEAARGEAIAMVILDEQPPQRAVAGALMPSVDVAVVQQMFGDDVTMFKSLMGRMLKEFADFALPTSVSADDESARAALKARVHKLKGSAGMIGATRVMRLAGAAEKALQESRPVDVVDAILAQLAAALTTLNEEAKSLLEGSEPTAESTASTAGRRDIGVADIDELRALLESQNMAALDKFGLLAPSLSELLGAGRFDRLREAIDDLNFQLGAELLREHKNKSAIAAS